MPRSEHPTHICEACGNPFTAKRTDARFCSAKCRAAGWRPVEHHVLDHQADGYVIPANESGAGSLRTCHHQLDDHEFCPNLATWKHRHTVNREAALIFTSYYCDEHVHRHAPEDTPIGEPLHAVRARNARQARAQHGTPVREGS